MTTRYRLTRQADDDISRIYFHGAERFGIDQADRYHSELATIFELIALNPEMARERHEIEPAVRIHPHKSHLIVYQIEKDGRVLIIRVRHGQENWDAEPT